MSVINTADGLLLLHQVCHWQKSFGANTRMTFSLQASLAKKSIRVCLRLLRLAIERLDAAVAQDPLSTEINAALHTAKIKFRIFALENEMQASRADDDLLDEIWRAVNPDRPDNTKQGSSRQFESDETLLETAGNLLQIAIEMWRARLCSVDEKKTMGIDSFERKRLIQRWGASSTESLVRCASLISSWSESLQNQKSICADLRE